MKRLLVLWDPENPLVPARPVVEALQARPGIQVLALTFPELGHPTLPNGAFKLPMPPAGQEADAILWIEGGPLPGNLAEFSCPKACWLLNSVLEPTLIDEVGGLFDIVLSASLRDSAEEKALWLPPARSEKASVLPPPGVSLLVDDPSPPEQVAFEHALQDALAECGSPAVPVVVVHGNEGRVHPMLMDCLQSGVAVVVDPKTDLRGVAHAGEHLDVFPSLEELPGFVKALVNDQKRLTRLSSRGPAIVDHLHLAEMRAARICDAFWPSRRVLSGETHHPRISILVTCHRYLRRLRVCLESLARQELPPGTLEIVVADPSSPDGLAEALEDFARQYPNIRVVHLPIDPRYHRNRGVGINRAFEASRGDVVIAIDGDLVFPPTLIGRIGDLVLKSPDRVFGVRRCFVGKEDTERILAGELDPFVEFDRLSGSPGDGEEKGFVGVLGYCQATNRKAFARARYPEEFDAVNQSDIVFVERLAREAKVTAQFLSEETVLHLWHPRNWMGTSEWL